MTLKELKIFDLVNFLYILDKENKKVCDIYFVNDKPSDYVSFNNDKRTELEKYNQYKDYKILEIKDLDIDVNFENNYITVKIDL